MTTEFVTASDGVKLAFGRAGVAGGPPVMLVHGFGSSHGQNWKSTGWYSTLTAAGFAILAMDCRGHGMSGKPHDPALYGHDRMAEDVVAVMDETGIAAAHYCGYSMGGFIGLRFIAAHPARVRKLALCGVGEFYLRGPRISDPGARDTLAEALEMDDASGVTDQRAIMFRKFAEQPGKDRLALAACMRAMSPRLPSEALAQIVRPVMVVCGEKDDIAGPPDALAAQFAHGRAVTIAARDHMSAVGDQKTRNAVTDFFLA